MLLVIGSYEKTNEYFSKKFGKEYFYFSFAYVPLNERFKELDRFICEPRTRFVYWTNRFTGPCIIDISEWNKKPLNNYFDAFMFYLADLLLQKQKIFLSLEGECSTELQDKLNFIFKQIMIKELEPIQNLNKNRERVQIGFHFSNLTKEQDEYVRSKI